MIFSERLKVSKEVDAWIEKYGAVKTTLNMMGALDSLGYLPQPAPAPQDADYRANAEKLAGLVQRIASHDPSLTMDEYNDMQRLARLLSRKGGEV